MSACIVGWSHTPFGKQDARTSRADRPGAEDALADAGLEATDIDEIVLGHFNGGGFSPQDFTGSLVLQADDACASSRRPGWKTPVRPVRPPSTRA